jgi:hypothetical protein
LREIETMPEETVAQMLDFAMFIEQAYSGETGGDSQQDKHFENLDHVHYFSK